jgi:hypothetical protein
MLCYRYGVDCSITLNVYEVIPPVVCDFGILWPWVTQQHGVIGVQYVIFHHYESDNIWNTMDMDFQVSN